MDMDDKDFLVVRKNLNVLSVLILVLAFTNAEIDNLNLLGIQMELDGRKLYVALFVGYLYFLWRYLTKLPLKSGFWTDFIKYYLESDEGIKSRHTFQRYQNEFMQRSEPLTRAINSRDSSLYITSFHVVQLENWPMTKYRLSITFQSSREPGSNDMSTHSVEHEIHVSRFFLCRKVLVFSTKYDSFGDYLFPLVPALVNLFLFLVKATWQGSIQNLING